MADTGTTVRATDTDALIKQWRASARRVEQIARGTGRENQRRPTAPLGRTASRVSASRGIRRVGTHHFERQELAGSSPFSDKGKPAILHRLNGAEMMRDWQPDVLYADPSTPAGLRTMLQARYQHLVLKFTTPPVSDKYEASWTQREMSSLIPRTSY